MYTINISFLTLNDESITLILIYALAIIGIIYMATKKVKVKKLKIKKEIVYNQEEKFSVSNYTLDFKNDEVLINLQPKKISVTTKALLMAFVLVFILTPFNELIFTLESSVNHSYVYFSGWSCLG